MSDLDTEELLKGDERILAEAKRRFKQCEDWEGKARNLFLDDVKFANGDSDNMWQWEEGMANMRRNNNRPCLTINKTQQHNLQIINEARQNKTSVVVRPVGEEASYEAAEVYEGIVRHIEYNSDASTVYTTATKFQVEGGIGYARVSTDYAGDDSFDQEIFIEPINDPLTIYDDPDIVRKDGLDRRFLFVFDDMPLDEAKEAFPKYKDKFGDSPLSSTASDGWVDKDHVRIAEYWRCSSKEDRLISFTDPLTGTQIIERVSKIPKEIVDAVTDDPATRFRKIHDDIVEQFLIIGNNIVERNDWLGKYIPFARAIGIETVIDGELDRKGHTRALKDPQRLYNYWSSVGVEAVALQTKTPWIAPAVAIEGYETYWRDANTANPAVLPYKHVDDEGNPIDRPQRQDPPTMPDGYIKGMQIAQNEMMMVSGQYEATFGQKGNETSGRAINERQRQGDTATYHFIDNQAIFIRAIGKILIDLIPKVYDTPRVVRILAEDGTESQVRLDPNSPAPFIPTQPEVSEEEQADNKRTMNAIKGIFNPNVGKYEVIADTGPAYGTKRQEAYNALSQIMTQNPQAMHLVGDLWAENSDFPSADKIARRFRSLLPPQALGKGLNPQVAELQAQLEQSGQQLQKMQQMNGKLLETLAEERMRARAEAAQKQIDVFKAETDRMKVQGDIIAKHAVTPQLEAQMMHDLALQEHANSLDMVSGAMARDLMPAPQTDTI